MVSIKFTDETGNNQFIEESRDNRKTMEDCCSLAKDVFN